MTISDSFLSNAAILFFALWTAVVTAVSVVAFGRDVVPRRVHVSPAPKAQRPKHSQTMRSSTP